jgi:hypothetical protein
MYSVCLCFLLLVASRLKNISLGIFFCKSGFDVLSMDKTHARGSRKPLMERLREQTTSTKTPVLARFLRGQAGPSGRQKTGEIMLPKD